MSQPNTLQYLGKHKAWLQEFWKEFMPPGYGRKGVSPKSKSATIAAIKRMGEVVLTPSKHARTPAYNRKQYETYKKFLKGYNGFTHCFACKTAPAQCRHHLIWIKNGGRNHKRNIIGLCNACHAEIHPWLKKDLPAPTTDHTAELINTIKDWGFDPNNLMHYVLVEAMFGEIANEYDRDQINAIFDAAYDRVVTAIPELKLKENNR